MQDVQNYYHLRCTYAPPELLKFLSSVILSLDLLKRRAIRFAYGKCHVWPYFITLVNLLILLHWFYDQHTIFPLKSQNK